MKLDKTVQKTIRMEMEQWMDICKYAEGVDLKSENDLLLHLIKLGIETAREIEIDNEIAAKEEVPPKTEILNEQKEPEKQKKEDKSTEGNKDSMNYNTLKILDEEGPKW